MQRDDTECVTKEIECKTTNVCGRRAGVGRPPGRRRGIQEYFIRFNASRRIFRVSPPLFQLVCAFWGRNKGEGTNSSPGMKICCI